MSNVLPDGTVLPSGLLGNIYHGAVDGFNKTYRNTALRAGVVVQSYPTTDSRNKTKLSTEYDVICVEQNEDRGATTIMYRNCVAMDGLGGIADFFEKNYRKRIKKKYKIDAPKMSQQDGSVVIILCLDGVSDKAIILGGFPHPDRTNKISTTDPQLQFEYNGVHVSIASDGSFTLTFRGATDNSGAPTDPSQGNTVATIEKDGSFQINHSTITFRLDKGGAATLTASGDMTINCQNANVNTQADATVTATGTATVEGQTVKLGKGASEAVVKGDTFKQLFDAHIHPTPIGPSGPPTMPLSPSALSKKVKTE
jgi:hypothetical protein